MKEFMRLAFLLSCLCGMSASGVAQNLEDQAGNGSVQTSEKRKKMHPLLDVEGPYEATWESLDKHQTPQWFLDDKVGFSMHWGPYAVPAWASQKAGIGPGSYSEWYFNQMYVDGAPTRAHHDKVWGKDFMYDQFIPMFTAKNFNADDWMKGLAENGVRYFFITAKHHDGFCLWDTKYTDRNAVKMGPKRDILGELVTAARKYKVKIGFYYSLYEWYNPQYVNELTEKTWLGTPEEQRAHVAEMGYLGYKPVNNYVDDFMVPQIVELIDNYQPDYLCFDGEWDHSVSYWRGRQIAAYYYNQAAKRGQKVLLNDRFGKGTRGQKGDFFHVEYYANVDKTLPWAMWRGFGKSFGHNTNEAPEAFLTPKQVVEMVVDCAANNGNIEFNVGPTIDGRIDEPEWSLVQQMGAWLRVNGEAIYGAKPSPMGKLKFGRLTHKPAQKKLFVHVFDWPNNGQIKLKGLNNTISAAYVISDKKTALKVNQSQKGLKIIQGPNQAPGMHVPVIVLEYQGDLEVVEYFDYQKADNADGFSLQAIDAVIKGGGLRYEESNKALGFWTGKNDYPVWGVEVAKKGALELALELACPKGNGGSFYITVDGKQIGEVHQVATTSGWSDFKTVSLGTIKLNKGKHKIAVKPVTINGALMNLKQLVLKK